MNRLALAAAAGLAATALAGAAAIPAAGNAKVYTKRFVAHDIKSHSFGPNTFAGTAVDRRAGKVIGYDSFTGRFHPKLGRADIWDSAALRGGTISVIVHFTTTTGTGRILNGTGKYKGIRGTVTARQAPKNDEKTYITLTYHF